MGDSGGLNIVALAITLFGSLLASYMTTELLFTITNHTEIWIFFFTQLTILISIAIAMYNYIYGQKYRNDLWWQVRQNFHVFIQMTFFMADVRLIIQVLIYAVDVSPMRITDYMNLFVFTIFVIFVLFTKFQVFLN